MVALDIPAIGSWLAKWAGPEEAYSFWEVRCPGFRNPCRDLTIDDVTPNARRKITTAFASMLTPKRRRIAAKITGWPRISYLHEVFPDAIFIHVRRDLRAVANSLLEVEWWDGWRGPSNWRRGELPEDLRTLWERFNNSFVALAGIECLLFERALAACRDTLGEKDVLDIDYGMLCCDPIGTFKNVVIRCELDWSDSFERHLRRFSLKSSDHKWRENLTPTQQRILSEVLAYGIGPPDRKWHT